MAISHLSNKNVPEPVLMPDNPLIIAEPGGCFGLNLTHPVRPDLRTAKARRGTLLQLG